MDALDDFYTERPFVDKFKTTPDKGGSNIFPKGLVFGLDDYQF